MSLSRSIGSILRGDSTPFQLMAACILASMLAFVPSFREAPGLLLCMVFLLIIVNANLGMSALIGGLAKLVSIPLVPVSFEVGRFLLDGPLQGIFKVMVNSPVLAFFGFEHYLVAGGQAVGLLFGVLTGVAAAWLVTKFRKQMVALEKGSEKFIKWSSNIGVKILSWVFLGGRKKKKSYEEFLGKKIGNPVRPLGIVFVVFLGLLFYSLGLLMKEDILTTVLREGLERANGATVEVDKAEVDFKSNKLTVEGLAIADASNLETDLFRAEKLEADINTKDLLRKRIKLDRILVRNATHGEKRDRPGEHVGKPPKVSEPPASNDPEQKTIDDYVKQATEIKQKLAKLKEWVEGMSGDKEGDDKAGDKGKGASTPKKTRAEEIKRQIEEFGHGSVRALHLLEEIPAVLVGEVLAEKVKVPGLEEEPVEIRGKNLSSHPWLVDAEKEIALKSSKGTFGARISLGGAESGSENGKAMEFHYKGIPAEDIVGGIKIGGKNPLKGGTLDISTQGVWSNQGDGMVVDLPLLVTLNNAQLEIPHLGTTTLGQLALPIAVKGPLDNPRIKVDSKQVVAAAKDAALSGGKQLIQEKGASFLKDKLGDKLPQGLIPGTGEGGQGIQLPKIGGGSGFKLPGGLFPQSKPSEEKPAAETGKEEEKKQPSNEDAVKGLLNNFLRGN